MEWISRIMDPEFIVIVLAVIATLATVFAIVSPYFEQDKFGQRMKSVKSRTEELKIRQRQELLDKKSGSLRSDPRKVVKSTVERLNLRNLLEDESTRMSLAQAGYRSPGSVYTYLFFRVVSPVILFVATIIYLVFVNDLGLVDPLMRLAASAGAAFLGFYLPNVYLSNSKKKRQESIRIAFPDALDLLLICIEAGMSMEASFQKVTQEIAVQSLVLAEEMGLTTAELNYLGDRRQALENLALRTGMDGVKAVTTALSQAERYGTPLGMALRVMAQENRDERMSRAETKAASLPAKLTVPMIVFFLPCLFVVILGPAILRIMEVMAG